MTGKAHLIAQEHCGEENSIDSTSSYQDPYTTNAQLQKFRDVTDINGNLYISGEEQIDFSVFRCFTE